MPRWTDVKRFVENDGWELYKATDQDYYRKQLPDGTLRRTKVSRSSKEINPDRWRNIQSRQLGVSQEYFNRMS